MSNSPLAIIKRLCYEQSSSLRSAASALDNAETHAHKTLEENERLRKQVADFQAAAFSLLEMYELEKAAHMSTKSMLEEARRMAGLPWNLCNTDIAAVSYDRLRLDPRFQSNIRAMTSFWSIESLDLFFDVVLGFSDDVLPCRYTPGRSTVTGPSQTSREDHKNYMFFALYLLRTGAQSFELAGMLFGMDKATASLWSRLVAYIFLSLARLRRYVTWLQVLAFALARLFPQPDEELIWSVAPPKFKKLYSRLVGIIDCTECKTQTPSEKLAQRALWSEYKHNNTIKYLVIVSPSGATVYVSPAFPGRISDPQICHACATYSEADFGAIPDIIDSVDIQDIFEE